MRVLFLTHYFAPERGAPQTRLLETARALQGLGHQVRVLTGPPHYPSGRVMDGYTAAIGRREIVEGIRVLRLPMIPRPNGGFVNRVIDQSSFSVSALAAIPALRWADAFIVESPPLFLGVTAAFHKLVCRRPYIFHVADPWPDFPIAMGALDNPIARTVAFGIEDLAYRHASLITTVTPGLVTLLDRKASARGRVRLLPNAVALDRFKPGVDPADARRSLGWPEAKLTLAYVGSVGLAQGVGTLIDAVAPFAGDGVTVRIIGEGYEREQLVSSVRARGLTNVHFDEPIAAQAVPAVLAAADALVVMLRRGPLYESALPTKLVEGLAAGRPILVSASGEAARLVLDAGAGYLSAPEDAPALRQAIRSCLEDRDRASRGKAGRRLAEMTFDRVAIVARLSEYLDEVTRSGPQRPARRRPGVPAGG